MTENSISARTRIPIEKVKKHLVTLCDADERSRTPTDDGRRLKLIDEHRNWGWFIINYDKFREIASDMQRRERTRLRTQKYREKLRGDAPVTHGNACVTPSSASVYASDSSFNSSLGGSQREDKPAKRPNGIPSNESEAADWASMSGVPAEFAKGVFQQCEGVGWVDGTNRQIVNWRAYVSGRYSRTKTIADNGTTNGKSLSIFELKEIVRVKEERANQMKERFSTQGPISVDWSDETKRKEWIEIRTQIKTLKAKIEARAS